MAASLTLDSASNSAWPFRCEISWTPGRRKPATITTSRRASSQTRSKISPAGLRSRRGSPRASGSPDQPTVLAPGGRQEAAALARERERARRAGLGRLLPDRLEAVARARSRDAASGTDGVDSAASPIEAVAAGKTAETPALATSDGPRASGATGNGRSRPAPDQTRAQTSSGSPPPRWTDGSIRDRAAVSPAVASLLIGHPKLVVASTAVGRGPRLLARARAERSPP